MTRSISKQSMAIKAMAKVVRISKAKVRKATLRWKCLICSPS